jgi:hypothetical protein
MRTTNRKPAAAPLTEIVLQVAQALATDPYLPPDLPAVYCVAWQRCPTLSLGTFHDASRQLHEGGACRLQPCPDGLSVR